jgi:hypothetical protein
LLRSRFIPRIMPPSLGGARLRHVESVDSDTTGERDDVQTFWEHAVESQCEGLMVKVRGVFTTLSLVYMTCAMADRPALVQLLDSGEILEEEGEEEEDGGNNGSTSSPKKSKRKTRRKPLPATYEPGRSYFLPY